jgi:hypothetical protein
VVTFLFVLFSYFGLFISFVNLKILKLELESCSQKISLKERPLFPAPEVSRLERFIFLESQHEVDRPDAVAEQERLRFFILRSAENNKFNLLAAKLEKSYYHYHIQHTHTTAP